MSGRSRSGHSTSTFAQRPSLYKEVIPTGDDAGSCIQERVEEVQAGDSPPATDAFAPVRHADSGMVGRVQPARKALPMDFDGAGTRNSGISVGVVGRSDCGTDGVVAGQFRRW